MKNYRKWGSPPYTIAVIHGGPGAPGEMAPVARELSSLTGVLEPIQTRNTFEGQVRELRETLETNANLPVILIGFSWGAFLSYVLTARYPHLVKKLVLIGSGPFVERYAAGIEAERLNRLSEEERVEAFGLIDVTNDPSSPVADKDKSMARLAALFAGADTFAPLPSPPREKEVFKVSEEINRRVWAEAKPLRISGELLELGKKIKCPVLAIHGDYDPHPAAGVKGPLSGVIKNFRFVLLKKCGHEPWLERYAREEFFKILNKEIV